MSDKLSKVEIAKQNSRHLRGTVQEVLSDEEQTHFPEDDLQVLKFHGIYQQDDRDKRIERRKAGLDKAYSMMIRIALPGGRLTPGQYLDLDDLCDSHANGTLRITTRQSFQLHGVLKGDLHATMKRISEQLMTSLSACGDIPRNMMATPAPVKDEAHAEAQMLASELALALAPKTGAYHEIWIDGEKVLHSDKQKLDEHGMVVDLGDEEPFYGNSYLPRKFKVGVALDTDNSIDVYANDCALIAVTENGKTLGYNLCVGGGFGMTHNKAETIARLATPVVFVSTDRVLEAVRNVVAIFRDHGDRENRRGARIKYLMEEWGVEKFRAELESRLGDKLEDPRDVQRPEQLDHLGRHDQGDGKQWVGVYVPSGRIKDEYKAAFRKIAVELSPGIVLTPGQSILFTDLEPAQADRVEQIMKEHDLPFVEALSGVRRYNMACPALPTCGLALTDSERAMPDVIDGMEAELDQLGLKEVPMTVRMTGCPNGCARPYNADIGLVGRKPGVYHLYVGGGLSGDRMADLFAADVPLGELNATLRPLLQRFAAERLDREELGDFYRRLRGQTEDRKLVCGKEEPQAELIELGGVVVA